MDASSVVAADVSELEMCQIIEELLTLRSQKKALVEVGNTLYDWLTDDNSDMTVDDRKKWDALLKEIK